MIHNPHTRFYIHNTQAGINAPPPFSKPNGSMEEDKTVGPNIQVHWNKH